MVVERERVAIVNPTHKSYAAHYLSTQQKQEFIFSTVVIGKIGNMATFYLSFSGSLLWRWKCSTCHNQRGEGRPQSHCKYWLCVPLFSLSSNIILLKYLHGQKYDDNKNKTCRAWAVKGRWFISKRKK